jgi:hypothetical protein
MGSDTLNYTIQLLDRNGVPVGPEPDVNRTFNVTTYVINLGNDGPADRPTDTVDLGTNTLAPATRKASETMTPDSNGRISIRIPHPDPNGATVDFADVLVVVTVELGGGAQDGLPITDVAHPRGAGNNTVRTVPVQSGGEDLTVAWAGAVFSDDARAASTYTISTRNWGRFSSTGNPNEVTLTLLDQYGDTYSGTAATRYQFTLTTTGGTPVPGNVTNNGRARIVYTSPVAARSEVVGTDSVIAVESSTGNAPFATAAGVTAEPPSPEIYWAEPGSADDGTAIVRVADPAARSIVVEGGTDDPEYYVFGTDDTFAAGPTVASATPLSFAQFMEVLNAANTSSIPEITINTAAGSETMLTWDSYNVARPRDRAKWTLTGVCSGS